MVHSLAGSLLRAEGRYNESEAEYLKALAAWEEAGRGETTDMAAVLETVREHLTPDGLFYFDLHAPHPAMLPAGFYDLLPPEAEIEAAVTGRLMGVLAAHGYDRVKPPLVEFEETLLSGAGAVMASDTFRTMDPISHRMIGVRADMTPQVARIAATRLSHRPRPLRLSYAGQVLRVKGSEMRPERQTGQAGAELIGAGGPEADVEVIAVAGEALAAIGVPDLSVDLTLPILVPAIVEAYGIAGERVAALRAALDHKDAAAVAALAIEPTTIASCAARIDSRAAPGKRSRRLVEP
jgi:ATP phosphoribosyltransferase regulatory subunit HisZ